MKKIGIFFIILSIFLILYNIFNKKEDMNPGIILTEEQKISMKIKSVCSGSNYSQRCFQKILTYYIDELFDTINNRIYEHFVKMIIDKHSNVKNSVNDKQCYKKINDFATDSIAVLMDLNRDDNLKNINIKDDIDLFMKRYIFITELIKKKIKTYKFINIPDNYGLKTSNTTQCINKSLEPETYIKKNLDELFFRRVRILLKFNDYKNYSNEILLFRPDELQKEIEQDIIDDKNSQKISELISEKINIISKTIGTYYCGISKNCCYKNDCDKIKKQMNDTNNNMIDVYKRRYELCLKRNKEIKKNDFNC